jgi:hypothetical protein
MEKEISEDEDENKYLSSKGFDSYQERRLQYMMKREENFRSDVRRREEAHSEEMRRMHEDMMRMQEDMMRMQEDMRRRETAYMEDMRRRETAFAEDMRLEKHSLEIF